MNPQHPHTAQVRVGGDLEDMGEHMGLGVGGGMQRQGIKAFATQKLRRIALGRVW